MDPASLFGFIIAWVMLIGSIIISGNPLALYWDVGSLILVVVGSIAATIMASHGSHAKKIPTYIGLVFKKQSYNIQDTITQLVGFAESARKDGLLSLDDAVKDIQDPFLSGGLRLVVDGTDPLIIAKIMQLEIEKLDDRHSEASGVFDTWVALAPAFGMLGTVMGLVGMMANLSDTASIGKGMALALITTFYGSIVANVIAMPMGSKLKVINQEELFLKEIMMEGVLGIQSGDNPRILEQKLFSFLAVRQRPASKEL